MSVFINRNRELSLLNERFKSNRAEFVLRQELSEPRYYFSFLLSIAKGNHRIGLITNDTGLSISIVNKYLSILCDLQLVNRIVPVTESLRKRQNLFRLRGRKNIMQCLQGVSKRK